MSEPMEFTQTPCTACGQISTENEEMVGCENCDQWYHFRCVGVTTEMMRKEKKWFCSETTCQETAVEYRKNEKGKKSKQIIKSTDESDRESKKSDRQSVLTIEQRLKSMEKNQKLMEKEVEAEWLLKEKEMNFRCDMEKKKLIMERKMREKEEENTRIILEEKLKEKREHLERMRAMQSSYEKEMSSLDRDLYNLKVVVEDKKERHTYVEPDQAVPPTNHKKRHTPLRVPAVCEMTEDHLKKLNIANRRADDDIEADIQSYGDCESELSEHEYHKVMQTGNKQSDDTMSVNQLIPQSGPTKAQLTARGGLTKNLPSFTGKPEEWPLFYGTFCASNEACGYSNVENLVRLQESLKGQALEMVRGQMLLPKSVPRVIEKLRQLYGRPELLLQSLLEKVRKLDPPTSDRLASFIPFGNAVEQLCEHIEAAGLTQHLINPLLIQDLVDKLPDSDKRQWVRYKRNKVDVTLRTFTDFIAEIVADACEANVNIEHKTGVKITGSLPPGNSKVKVRGALYSHSESEYSSDREKQKACKVCHRTDHRLRYCQDFRGLTYEDRMTIVTRWKLCKICLNNHGNSPCKLRIRCNIGECRDAHNPLLHPIEGAVGMSAHIQTNSSVLFRMIPIKVYYGEKSLTVLAFLDEGASVTLVEKRLADRLGVNSVQEKLTIKWTADITRVEKESRKMNLWISAIGAEEKLLLKTVRTVGNLMLPQQTLNVETLSRQYKHLGNLPITSYDGRPEILIGLNNIHSFIPIDAKIGSTAEPIAVRCPLGWTVYGPSQAGNTKAEYYLGYHQGVSNEDLHDLLKNHYALEESVMVVPQESSDEKRAREILERTTKRVEERFETGLLWKTDNQSFPDSFPMAMRRLKQLEKRLGKDPDLYNNVCKQIEDYQSKGYAHLATAEELRNTNPESVWYLPLSVVLNPKKPGKVRLVWDAAASVKGVSLNSQLLKGPDMLVSLISVIIGFRERRIAVGGDIREMYHQIKIKSEDRQAQRFIFRTNPNKPVSIFVMDVATFGSTSSPCSAQYVKNQNAKEYAAEYPEAAAAIIDRHYVDDYFQSFDTVQEAILRAKQVSFIHSKAGFEIHNWVSNSPEVLRGLKEHKSVEKIHFNRNKETESERVLGIIWDPEHDEFFFSTQHREELNPFMNGEKRPTKRMVLSCVMGFFDPLGLLSLFTIHGKVIVQHLWRSGCGWDQEISDDCWEMWKRWIGLLPDVGAIRIPRCYTGDVLPSSIESLEIHIFTDASEQAYGCVAYLRAVISGEVRCNLIMSRAKVAPLKRQSIPRLELMAAVLGARIYQTILETHTLKFQHCTLWTDSRTVYSWIHSDQHKYKQFVAFRIGEIWESTKVTDWRWIPSKFNLADMLTKWGHDGPSLTNEGEWFAGASFLYKPVDQWPSQVTPIDETNEDARGVVLFHEVVDAYANSKWMTMLRVTANVVRFTANCRRKQKGEPILASQATENQQKQIRTKLRAIKKPLQQEEFQEAENILWKQVQFESFPDEMSILTKNLERTSNHSLPKIERSSVLYNLTPLLDEKGVLRVGGRMEKSEMLPFDTKFPVILSRKHEITKKLIQFYHEKYGHAYRETVFNELRKKFYIPNLRAAIKEVMKKCMWCKVKRCQPKVPIMAPLPIQRITPCLRPFSSVGVDYLGPIVVSVGRRKEKRWVAVFTCLAVRAVHLEVVYSLTTQSCLMAIRRFICKRGAPKDIFSDNATCFKGANNELDKIHKQINNECAEKITSSSIAWHFIPPGTPHMGGIWERMVRSVKEAIKALDDGRKLIDEILTTTLSEAEDMINSRPLTYIPQESAEHGAITPNDFLRGPMTDADFEISCSTNLSQALRDTYKRSQYLADQMWERWCNEYLPSINKRTKWFEEQRPLQIGDLVFIVDGKNRKHWLRGIIEDVFKGSDGRVRQASIRTSRGIFRRGVANLAVMEISEGKSGTSVESTGCYGQGYVNTA